MLMNLMQKVHAGSSVVDLASLASEPPSFDYQVPCEALKNWSRAGFEPGPQYSVYRAVELHLMPHGPEPWLGRVLRCPKDSCVVLANTKSTRLVSFGDPEDPRDSGRL